MEFLARVLVNPCLFLLIFWIIYDIIRYIETGEECMEFKEKVYKARMKLGLTQEAMAKELGIAFVTINRWENGVSHPNKLKEYKFNEFCKTNYIEFEE